MPCAGFFVSRILLLDPHALCVKIHNGRRAKMVQGRRVAREPRLTVALSGIVGLCIAPHSATWVLEFSSPRLGADECESACQWSATHRFVFTQVSCRDNEFFVQFFSGIPFSTFDVVPTHNVAMANAPNSGHPVLGDEPKPGRVNAASVMLAVAVDDGPALLQRAALQTSDAP